MQGIVESHWQSNCTPKKKKKAELEKTKSPFMTPIYMHVFCVHFKERGRACTSVIYPHVLSIHLMVLYQSINMVNTNLFPQFKSPQGGNPGLSQLKKFKNSSYGKRI
jgi:hypothetical protein